MPWQIGSKISVSPRLGITNPNSRPSLGRGPPPRTYVPEPATRSSRQRSCHSRPPHRDPRRAEALHQRRFAGELLPRRVMPTGDIALQAFAYLLVHRFGGNGLRHGKAVISALCHRMQPAIIGSLPRCIPPGYVPDPDDYERKKEGDSI